MLQSSSVPLSKMDIGTMRAVYNALADERGAPKGMSLEAERSYSRVDLGKGIALLRSTSKPKTAKVVKDKPVSRKSARMDAITAALLFVSYYVYRAQSITAEAFAALHPAEQRRCTRIGDSYRIISAKLAESGWKNIDDQILRRYQYKLKQERGLPMPAHPATKGVK